MLIQSVGAKSAVAPPPQSELLDGRFLFQQNRNVIANGIHALALIALQAVLAAQH